MKILMIFILVIYFVALLFIFTYSITQATLIKKYLKQKKHKKVLEKDETYQPLVTIQLPVFNELYVVERLIDQVCAFNYPLHLLEIQVLDDSTDETKAIIETKVSEWNNKGIDIVHIHRTNRVGYKAGALEEGLAVAKGEFIAIFDADFMPQSNFIKSTIPYFINQKIGMVQTKWAHLNRDYSLLTQLQAYGLDAHFSVEQVGRNANNGFINFNGTAGIWRKSCIIDAGNWQPDTLTEDLDLSYRAQLKDWEFVYLENHESPAELPPVMSALKTQQYRWNKGGAESAKKHLWNVLKSNKPFDVKWHGVMHLLNSAIFLSIFVSSLLSVPLLYIKIALPEYKSFFMVGSLFVLSFFILASFYYVASAHRFQSKWSAFLHLITTFPVFLSVSMGLSLHNGIAVMEGYLGKKTPFIRTPKFNLNKNNDAWTGNIYLKTKLSGMNILELLAAFYFAFGIYKGFVFQEYGFIALHFMLTIGFLAVFYFSIKQSFNSKNI